MNPSLHRNIPSNFQILMSHYRLAEKNYCHLKNFPRHVKLLILM